MAPLIYLMVLQAERQYISVLKVRSVSLLLRKNYEQAEKYNIPLEELGDWNRYELRLKNERAQVAIDALLKTKDLTLIAMQIINNYVRFVDADENITREHWKTSLFGLNL